jgi:hypothetical protein
MKKQPLNNSLSRRSFLEKTAAVSAGIAVIPGSAALSFSLKSCSGQSPGSLIPNHSSNAPDYYCTWGSQAYFHSERLLNKYPDQFATLNPEMFQYLGAMLTEETLLGENGLARTLFPDTRDGLYFLLDYGWDIPIVSPKENYDYFSSLILDTDKFPSCTGTPAERLRKLNDAFKDLGWMGIGLWVACEEAPSIIKEEADKYAKDLDSREPIYWVERMKWMAEAGVEYLKFDFGKKLGDPDFRKMITRTAQNYAPELWIEHAHVSAPFNTPLSPEEARAAKAEGLSWIFHDEGVQGRISPSDLAEFRRLIPISPVFRLYDVTLEMGIPTMLERAAHALVSFGPDQPTQCLLNCEIIPYMGAGLGLCIGNMQLPGKDINYHEQIIRGGHEICESILAKVPVGEDTAKGAPLNGDLKILEVVRTVNWHRIAPPYTVGGHQTHLSEEVLSDSWDLRLKKPYYADGLKDIMVQKAPATVCRNMDPVRVEAIGNASEGPQAPYVVASRHPNGAVSIATLGRLSPETGYKNPDATIEADLKKITAPVGLFGHFLSVTLKAENISKKTQVWAQDLAEKEPVNITSRVKLQPGSLTISGSLAREICRPFNESDQSEPGIVIQLNPVDAT